MPLRTSPHNLDYSQNDGKVVQTGLKRVHRNQSLSKVLSSWSPSRRTMGINHLTLTNNLVLQCLLMENLPVRNINISPFRPQFYYPWVKSNSHECSRTLTYFLVIGATRKIINIYQNLLYKNISQYSVYKYAITMCKLNRHLLVIKIIANRVTKPTQSQVSAMVTLFKKNLLYPNQTFLVFNVDGYILHICNNALQTKSQLCWNIPNFINQDRFSDLWHHLMNRPIFNEKTICFFLNDDISKNKL